MQFRISLDYKTYHLFTIHPAFGVSYKLLLTLSLLLTLLDCSLQDPGQGLRYHALAVVNDAVSSATAFGLGDTSAVLTTAVSGSIWRNWRRVHDLTIKGETLKRLKNCGGHFE